MRMFFIVLKKELKSIVLWLSYYFSPYVFQYILNIDFNKNATRSSEQPEN